MTQADAPVELTVAELAARIGRLAAGGGRRMLGIVGPPGAGKSTLAAALVERIGPSAAAVGMDGFHLAQAELRRLGRQDRKGAPDTFDSFGYAALLRRLRENADPVVYGPLFRRDLEEPIGGSVGIDRAVALIVTEGNYLLSDEDGWPLARRQLDEVWYLDLPEGTRLERLVQRHVRFGRDPLAAQAWAQGSDQRNADLVSTTRKRADLVIRLRPGALSMGTGQCS